MRRMALVVAWVALSGLGAGRVVAFPQESEKQDKPAQAEMDKGMQQKPKPTVEETTPSDEHREASVSLPQSAKSLGTRFLTDQKQIWTSPAQIRWPDTTWLVPLSGVTAGLFVTDAEMSRHISHNPTTVSHYNTASNAGVAALIGGAGAMWLLSYPKHNEHWRETGFLAGEAVLNSFVVVEAMKYPLGRERPNQGDGSGPFFKGGVSFPSEHATAAWAVAGVVAHEYPGPLTKILAYSLAGLVDYSRYRALQHFQSDVFIGSVIGNMVARDIYNQHHDTELGGAVWDSPAKLFYDEGRPKHGFIGSPYIPLDSWIYPVLDRLSAMGLISSGFAGIRPWTRLACAQMIEEAADRVDESHPIASDLVRELQLEFRQELDGGAGRGETTLRLESIYSRTEYISGMPLTDGYNFGQTQFNDFGRPYSGGWNTINGFSGYATSGPWVGYVRAEEQTAPSIPPLPLAAREAIQTYADMVQDGPHLPLQPGTATPSVTQFRLLDAYFGLMLSNWQFTYGKQSLSWGPGDGGSLTLGDNAPPINMFQISRTTPLKLPSFLGWLGPLRAEFFLGQLSGFEFIFSPSGLNGQWGRALADQPMIHGEKFSFKPTPNFEFGFFRTTIFAGEGYPFTWHTFLRSLFSTGNTPAGAPNKPGKRLSGLDFSYRLPRLRNWLTFYADGLAYDQFTPIAYADRSAWRAGLYLSHFPLVHNLDLRVEGVYTDNPIGGGVCCGFYYSNGTWRSGYTSNQGTLMGNWIGRDGQGAQAWTNYWFGARNRLQFNFRHEKISQQLMPGGGTLTDFGVRGDYWIRSYLGLSAWVQHERWLFPVIQPNASKNVMTAVQILFEPHKVFQHSAASVSGAVSGTGERP